MAIPLAEPAAAEHKALRKQIKKLKKVASTGQLDAAGTAELKALKKKAKAIKAASQATGGDGGSDGGEATAEQAAPAGEQQQQQGGGKAGGKKQKKRKSVAAEAAPAEAEAAEAAPAGKKQKKGKGAAAGGELPQGMAAVGDRGLAASRPALVKALYNEAAEVAATSAADVAAWRKERKTKVEGCALHPITSFAQSGERRCFFVYAGHDAVGAGGGVLGMACWGRAWAWEGGRVRECLAPPHAAPTPAAHHTWHPFLSLVSSAGLSADELYATRTFQQPSPIQAQVRRAPRLPAAALPVRPRRPRAACASLCGTQ